MDEIEKENQLLSGENKKYQQDIKEFELTIEAESLTKRELESAKLELEDQYEKAKKKLSSIELSDSENVKKIERLTALNEELRDLIDQEREINSDELYRLEKQSKLKIK